MAPPSLYLCNPNKHCIWQLISLVIPNYATSFCFVGFVEYRSELKLSGSTKSDVVRLATNKQISLNLKNHLFAKSFTAGNMFLYFSPQLIHCFVCKHMLD